MQTPSTHRDLEAFQLIADMLDQLPRAERLRIIAQLQGRYRDELSEQYQRRTSRRGTRTHKPRR